MTRQQSVLIFVFLILVHVIVHEAIEDDNYLTAGPPPSDKPWVPGWGYNNSDPTAWKKHHDDMINQTINNRDNIKYLFFGDSKIYYWKVDNFFINHTTYNYGIRGDSTRQILWRIDHGEIDGINPKLLVFMIGGNNFRQKYNQGTNEEIVDALLIIIDKFLEKLPNTKIIFIGQLPRKNHTNRAARINTLLDHKLHVEPRNRVTFCNFFYSFRNRTAPLTLYPNADLYVADLIHLNPKGYELLSDLVRPYIYNALPHDEAAELEKYNVELRFSTSTMDPINPLVFDHNYNTSLIIQ